MFAFSSAMQGYFVTRLNLVERLLLLIVVPFVMVPNMCAKYLPFINSEYMSYAIGIVIYCFIFATQLIMSKKVTSI